MDDSRLDSSDLGDNFDNYSNIILVKNKVVLITGASSGIGEALARKYAQEGAKVVIAARRESLLKKLAKELTTLGAQTHWVVTDVASQSDCERMVTETIDTFGQLDILINNAGISMRALFEETEPNVLERLMQVNFFGTMYATRYALPHILATKGSVVGVSSIAGFRGLPGRSGYSASKFAMHGFLETIRTEVMDRGVHVLVACPGFTTSNIRNVALTADGSQQGGTPRNEDNMMSSEAVADYIYRAVIRRKRTLVLTTQGKLVVFLNKWLPKFMDRMTLNAMKKEPDSPFK